MTSHQQSRLADHLDAALAAMPAATAAKLTHPDQAQRRSALAIMAQTLAARLEGDYVQSSGPEATALPRLPIDLQ